MAEVLTVLCPNCKKRWEVDPGNLICPACGEKHKEKDFCAGMKMTTTEWRKMWDNRANWHDWRKKTAERMHKEGLTIKEIARKMGENENTILGWIGRRARYGDL